MPLVRLDNKTRESEEHEPGPDERAEEERLRDRSGKEGPTEATSVGGRGRGRWAAPASP